MDGPTNGWPSDGSEIWRGGASFMVFTSSSRRSAFFRARATGHRCMVCRSTPRSKTASLSRYVSGSCSKSRSSMSCDGDRGGASINGARLPVKSNSSTCRASRAAAIISKMGSTKDMRANKHFFSKFCFSRSWMLLRVKSFHLYRSRNSRAYRKILNDSLSTLKQDLAQAQSCNFNAWPGPGWSCTNAVAVIL